MGFSLSLPTGHVYLGRIWINVLEEKNPQQTFGNTVRILAASRFHLTLGAGAALLQNADSRWKGWNRCATGPAFSWTSITKRSPKPFESSATSSQKSPQLRWRTFCPPRTLLDVYQLYIIPPLAALLVCNSTQLQHIQNWVFFREKLPWA